MGLHENVRTVGRNLRVCKVFILHDMVAPLVETSEFTLNPPGSLHGGNVGVKCGLIAHPEKTSVVALAEETSEHGG